MTHAVSRRLALLLAAALLVAGIAFALSLHSAPASASPFCGGQVVQPNNPCFGAQRAMSGDDGNGTEHSICIGANEIHGPCSSGPGAIATLNIGTVIQAVPWISDNASGSTVVHGETF
jgi:hypothetical protein